MLLHLQTPLSASKLSRTFFFDKWELLKGEDKCLFGIVISPVPGLMSQVEKVRDKCGLSKCRAAGVGKGKLASCCWLTFLLSIGIILKLLSTKHILSAFLLFFPGPHTLMEQDGRTAE